jgi:23S rRNA (cytosine1962-C5)-methyltransferase
MLLNKSPRQLIELRLARDLTRAIKRGHPWVFADALRQRPSAPPGTPAILLDNKKGRPIATGFYDATSSLAFRVCISDGNEQLSEKWAKKQLQRACNLRATVIDSNTTGYRLFNGEGDGLPGLICDRYDNTAVIQLDGPGPEGFWNTDNIAGWVARQMSLDHVYLKSQARQGGKGRALMGNEPAEPVSFLENGIRFTADVVLGQKTGFFLDQRDNRASIGTLARGRRVLNLFGYTGGFSVYAGLGDASSVTTVDLAAPALRLADNHWQNNNLPPALHRTVQADVFSYLTGMHHEKKLWDLVIVDPPSFAPSRNAIEKAKTAYKSLIAAAANVTARDGLLAVASCSSHIPLTLFIDLCENGVSQARRKATILRVLGQPADHPSPLPLPEFRYLKFILMRID